MCVYIDRYVCVYICVCVSVYICVCLCIFIYIYIIVCIYIYVSLYIYKCVFMCWGDLGGLWLGFCPKLKVRRFRGNYRMPVSPLSVCKYGCKYGWRRRPWSPAEVLLPISAEWGSKVFRRNWVRSECFALDSWQIAIWTSPRIGVTLIDSFTGTCGSRSMALSLIEDGLFNTSSKCSAHLSRILTSDMSLVPSALWSGERLALVGP